MCLEVLPRLEGLALVWRADSAHVRAVKLVASLPMTLERLETAQAAACDLRELAAALRTELRPHRKRRLVLTDDGYKRRTRVLLDVKRELVVVDEALGANATGERLDAVLEELNWRSHGRGHLCSWSSVRGFFIGSSGGAGESLFPTTRFLAKLRLWLLS